MKRLPFFFFLFLLTGLTAIAQNKYEVAWNRVHDLMLKKNLPKSALAEVKKIYTLAKKEGEDAQVIRSLVYIAGLQQETREENQVLSIKEIEAELPKTSEPSRSVLKTILAKQYWSYFRDQQWKIYNRTTTVGFKKDDPSTWGLDDFHRKISSLFLESVSNKKILQQTKLEPFDPVIAKGNLRKLRPTLYDLLANEALEYFKNDTREINKPAYAFTIDDPKAFLPAPGFVSQTFGTKDSLSLHHKALLIYQELLRFHLDDPDPAALVDADISRLQFVYAYSVLPDKETRYRQALELIGNKYGYDKAGMAWYLLASLYEKNASEYDPHKDTTNRMARLKAKEILEKIIADSSQKNMVWQWSKELLNEILKTTFSLTTEQVILPGEPFRTLVSYRNIRELHLRLVRTEKTEDIWREEEDSFWKKIYSASPFRSWVQPLPKTDDLQEHSVEIKVDELPAGTYILLASGQEKPDFDKPRLGAVKFYVSNIAVVNQRHHVFVLHRKSGQPLSGAMVRTVERQYDRDTRSEKMIRSGPQTVDANGYLQLPERKNSFLLEVTYQGETVSPDRHFYRYSNEQRKDTRSQKDFQEDNTNTYFFTDRSIYRPGQTIFLKGITSTRTKNSEHFARSGYENTLYLYDANYQRIDSLQVRTNEYGSFSGKFILPQTTLNGIFTLRMKDDRGGHSFRVEEYKRPKFQLEFEKQKNTYKLNDTITVTGTAKALAGNNISNAKVSYRVTRIQRPQFPWPIYRSIYPPGREQEITHGETITDGDGKFTVRFQALPDPLIDTSVNPVFNFTIHADVTDINGETRSLSHVIPAGYRSLILEINMPEKISKDKLQDLSVRTSNMNEEFQQRLVTAEVFRLTPEERLIRKRKWERPDQFVMSRQEFIRYFPNEEFDKETDPSTWPKTFHLTYSDTTSTTGNFGLFTNKTVAPGYYEIVFTVKDLEGKPVQDKRIVEVFDPAASGLTAPEYFWASSSSRSIGPGDKDSIIIGSSSTGVFLIRQIIKGQEQLADSFLFSRLDKEKKTFTFGAEESDRGGYGVAFFFIKDNSFYQLNDRVDVPWTNKELNIEYLSFRDKTLPGSREQWKIRVTGARKEKVAAEVLAGMYDASLDQFSPHQWSKPGIWINYYGRLSWEAADMATTTSRENYYPESYASQVYFHDRLIEFDDIAYYDEQKKRFIDISKARGRQIEVMKFTTPASDAVTTRTMAAPAMNGKRGEGFLQGRAPGISVEQASIDDKSQESYRRGNVAGYVTQEERVSGNDPVHIRKNLQETAFFYPELRTDSSGTIEFSFTAPDALTRWKLQTFAHTKDLAFGWNSQQVVTQKELMVQPNPPRFLRQGDRMEFSVKVVNLSGKEMTGQAELQLFDAATSQPVDGWFLNAFPNQYFTVAAGGSEVVKFPMEVPHLFNSSLQWRVVARSEKHSDGEEMILPVLSNRMLVTETMALPLKGNETKKFTFEKLAQNNSETLQHHSLTVEFTSNPAWYAVQALPYLAEFPYECAEQIWNRYYSNLLAAHIANSSPRLRKVFETWKTSDTSALLSNLQKNSELKSVLLEETPWVLQAKNETEQKKNIALLFDLVRLAAESRKNAAKLEELQLDNGGFPWFRGGQDDRYITQYILTGAGRLRKMKIHPEKEGGDFIKEALNYAERKIKEDYQRLKRSKADLNKQNIGPIQIQYLYLRSFFTDLHVEKTNEAYEYYRRQAAKFWIRQDKQMQAMIALSLHRTGDKQTPTAILRSLKETSITNEELGMYWKENTKGKSWYWNHAPIETQAMIIEAFSEITKDREAVDAMRTWLIRNKQTNNWATTKATADACYAFLMQGTDWLASAPTVQIRLGSIATTNSENKEEAGTGYFKKSFDPAFIKPEMGNISIAVKNEAVPGTTLQTSWGAIYWQYFEDMDKITSAATPLRLSKKLFVETLTDSGPVLKPVEEGSSLKPGDKIKVRIELRADRDMEYVHMKDLRASGLEPTNVLSGYRYQDGLSYYETTKDASTNFFFNYLRKGTYVFEYSLFVTHTGNFTNGITSIQCMYAPEFSAHSEGIRLTVE